MGRALADRVPPVCVQVVSTTLGWCPLSSFIVLWYKSGGTRRPKVVFQAVDVLYPGPLRIISNDCCPLTHPHAGHSVLVCDVEHTSFHFGLFGRKFVLC